MDDKNLMENILSLVKGAAGLYHHATVEASTPNVRETYKQAMNDTLCMQAEVFDKMTARGWYAPEQAEQNKLTAAKMKFCGK